MKKSILLLIVALASAMWSGNARAENTSLNLKGDTLEIVDGSDTTRIAGAQAIVSSINEILNKEVINEDDDNDSYNDRDNDYALNQRLAMERTRYEIESVAVIVTIVFGALLLIILVCLWFFYLNRRNKYRVIERAIENGYELPPSFTGKSPNPAPVVPPMPNPQTPYPPQNPYYQPQAPAAPGFTPTGAPAPNMPRQGMVPPAPNAFPQPQGAPRPIAPGQYNIDAFKNGFIWTVIGFAFVLFFLSNDALPMAVLGLIPVIIGLAKIGSEYYKQRNRINYENWLADQAAWKEQQQAQNNANNSNNGDTNTPPPFDNGNNSNL